MANSWYPEGLEAILDGSVNLETDNVRAALLRNGAYNSSHDFLNDLTAAGATVVATTGNLTGKTFNGGTFDATDDTFGTPAAGAACNAFVIYKHTGSDATGRLLLYVDDAPGLPVTPDGTNPIPVTWNASGIASI